MRGLSPFHTTVTCSLHDHYRPFTRPFQILFEWEAFSNLREFSVGNGYDLSTRGIVLTMLTAHWFYWSAVRRASLIWYWACVKSGTECLLGRVGVAREARQGTRDGGTSRL